MTARQDDEIAFGVSADDATFKELSKLDEIFWDYAASDHSTRGHPLQPLRQELRANRWPDARTISRGRDGQQVDYVGIVICRQQPGTASGVVFMTLEDETGFVNLVVWPQVFADFGHVIRTTSVLGASGKLQVQEGIVHLIVDRVTPAGATRDRRSSWDSREDAKAHFRTRKLSRRPVPSRGR